MKKKSYYKPKGKKKVVVKKKKYKSYYVPVSQRKVSKKVKLTTKKKKYKSYYKPKKKLVETVVDVAVIETPKQPVVQPTSKRPVKYLNNKDLLAEVIKSKKQGKMTDELAKMLQLLTMRYAKKGNFSGYCVDDKTQALTKRGWLCYDELSITDDILSYDIDTKNLVWSKVLGKYVDQYNGKMHYLTSQGLDALVTPNHKFVSVERGLIAVEDIICNEHIVLMPNNFCKAENIDFHEGKQNPDSRHKPNIATQQYNGIVWCPQTQYGTWVCRRNDYIYVTGNSYNEDMQSYAMLMICKTWDSFDPARSSNPFAYYTQSLKNSFIQYLNYEKRQRDIRDELLIDGGMSPSYGYSYDYENSQDDSGDSNDVETVEIPTKITDNDVIDVELPNTNDPLIE